MGVRSKYQSLARGCFRCIFTLSRVAVTWRKIDYEILMGTHVSTPVVAVHVYGRTDSIRREEVIVESILPAIFTRRDTG